MAAPIMEYAHGQMCFRQIWSTRYCAFDIRLYLLQLCRRQATDLPVAI